MGGRIFPWHLVVPRHTWRVSFGENANVGWKSACAVALAIIMEGWTCIVALQGWWWGQVYLKSALLLMLAVAGVCILLPLVFYKNAIRVLFWRACTLAVPALVATVVVVFLESFGLPLDVDRYLYRNPWLLTVILVLVGWVLAWDVAGARFSDREWKVQARRVFLVLIIDLVSVSIIAILLLNIESIF